MTTLVHSKAAKLNARYVGQLLSQLLSQYNYITNIQNWAYVYHVWAS